MYPERMSRYKGAGKGQGLTSQPFGCDSLDLSGPRPLPASLRKVGFRELPLRKVWGFRELRYAAGSLSRG